jgi:hypothetical protein
MRHDWTAPFSHRSEIHHIKSSVPGSMANRNERFSLLSSACHWDAEVFQMWIRNRTRSLRADPT